MSLFRAILFLFFLFSATSWPFQKKKFKSNAENTCCVSAKLNINATRANLGREFFANLILNNQSHPDVNEENICSLMHFFMQESVLNGRPIKFSKGMFVLYDSSKQFFTRLMQAKEAQKHGSEDERAGYFKRFKHFVFKSLKSLLKLQKESPTIPDAFIYVRGDESSHFRERGISALHRSTIYPAYGMDVKHGCMPNGFGHILFGQLKGLYNNESDPYYGDRIYIKPEEFGLQKFKHYVGHSGKYLKSVSRRILCKIGKFQRTEMCTKEGAFRENIDARLTQKWNQLLASIPRLTDAERETLRGKAREEGIHEIHRQAAALQQEHVQVRDFQKELESKYGRDIRSRKGNEIIFTTEQLLESPISCDPIILTSTLPHRAQCLKETPNTITGVLN